MLRFISAVILLSLTSFANSADDNLFQKGLAAYQSKQYSEARDHFQKLIESESISPSLLHNLALSYYQLDEAPMALALWRKALDLDADFKPAQAGRSFVEQKLQTRGLEKNPISETIQRSLEFVSIFELLWLLALMIAAVGWLWIRYFADRRQALQDEAPLPNFPGIAVTLSIVLLAGVALTGMKAKNEMKTRATIVAKTVRARSLPAEEGVGLFELRGGIEVLVRRLEKDWVQVQNSEGSNGWVKASELFITSGRGQ